MFNLSLARIMYGTNEDLHTGPLARAHSVSPVGMQTVRNSSAAAMQHESLGEMLHKAWVSLTKNR